MKTRRRPSNSVSTIPTVTQPSVIPMKESSFGSMVKQGFGWGLGSSLAHRLFTPTNEKPISEPVLTQLTYKQCMLDFNDEAACKQYLK